MMDPTHLSLELVPLDQPQAPAPPGNAPLEIEIVPMGVAKRDTAEPADETERFLKEATKQYEEGHIDQPLWDRALVQANNDKTGATATYLQARATALRLLDRDRRSGRRAAAANALHGGPGERADPEATQSDASERADPLGVLVRHRYWAMGAAALLTVGVGVSLLYGYGSTKAVAVARTVPVNDRPVIRSQAVEVATKANAAGERGKRPGPTPEFMNKIQQLNDAGNWNVLVLYAVEWTRLEPSNAAAWDQLRAGYVNLRQYTDAYDAATKAAQLAPGNSRMWRNLGQVNMDLNDPAEALRAFDKALAVSPDDATARCLRTSVAQLSAAPKDPKAAAKELKSFDSKCHGAIEPVAQR